MKLLFGFVDANFYTSTEAGTDLLLPLHQYSKEWQKSNVSLLTCGGFDDKYDQSFDEAKETKNTVLKIGIATC